MAAIFDLEGFTNFCKQIEPHLSVPRFLNDFTLWIFDILKEEMIRKENDDFKSLWAPLPFFVKFMGDGLLVLWNVEGISISTMRNIIISCDNICEGYIKELFPRLRKKVAETPRILRCGIARGTVYSIGDGQDFIGSCINMASRLQKLYGSSFAFNSRGFDIDDTILEDQFNDYIQKEVVIRGIGEHELVCIKKDFFDHLPEDMKTNFMDA